MQPRLNPNGGSASNAWAIRPNTDNVGTVPPASKRATADCVIPAADASSACPPEHGPSAAIFADEV